MREFLLILEKVLFCLSMILLCYGVYFTIMGFMGVFFKPKKAKGTKKNRFALVIAARNEAGVVGHLVESLQELDYPKELYDIIVVPNNCTDDTAGVARVAGAEIFECPEPVKVKADALSQVFDFLLSSEKHYDAFCVFDADNLVDSAFLNHMNDSLNGGATIAQGFRDAKNPDDSWISGSYSIYYYCVNSFMNRARNGVGLSAYINGTGFMVARDLVKKMGFKTYTLTEDNEYSIQCILEGEKVTYVPDAIIYDEHPMEFGASFKQRLRWSKGLIACVARYFRPLLRAGFGEGKVSALDALLFTLGPVVQVITTLLSVLTLIVIALSAISARIFILQDLQVYAVSGLIMGLVLPALLAIMACYASGKNLSDMRAAIFSFPIFLVTWIPINIAAIFDRRQIWEPIKHSHSISLKEMKKRDGEKVKI